MYFMLFLFLIVICIVNVFVIQKASNFYTKFAFDIVYKCDNKDMLNKLYMQFILLSTNTFWKHLTQPKFQRFTRDYQLLNNESEKNNSTERWFQN